MCCMNSSFRGAVAAVAGVIVVFVAVLVSAADSSRKPSLDTVPVAQVAPAVVTVPSTTAAPTTTTTTASPSTTVPETTTTTTAAPKPRPVVPAEPPTTTVAPWPTLPPPQPYTTEVLPDGSIKACVEQGCITMPPTAINCFAEPEKCPGWPTP